jgi:hypothetical protein
MFSIVDENGVFRVSDVDSFDPDSCRIDSPERNAYRDARILADSMNVSRLLNIPLDDVISSLDSLE